MKYRLILLVLLVCAIVWSAISPVSLGDWVLEILPVFITLPIVFYLHKHYSLSRVSYTLIFIYMLMPIAQAHYEVARVPLGFAISDWLGIIGRNSFDRLTHFAFGLLTFYPLYEVAAQTLKKKNITHFYSAFSTIMAVSSVYEIIELTVRQTASQNLSFLFVAAQGDFWDTSKDMAMSLIGCVLAMLITIIYSSIISRRSQKAFSQRSHQ